MKKIILLTLALSLLGISRSGACTNFIVTKGASTDGSIMVTYAADSHQLYGCLYKNIPGLFPQGTMRPVYEWDTGRFLMNMPEAAQTYSRIGNINEHQLVISETTYGGRSELEDPTGLIDYGSLIYITLERCKTAREAIYMIADLANTYGYASSGESLSIADKNEVWVMELIGKGFEDAGDGTNKNKGIVWVAMRIPDGYISAHANHARITTFPFTSAKVAEKNRKKGIDTDCLHSPDVISFARAKGYFNGKDEEFSFSDTYAPLNFSAMRGCEARVWAFFRTFATDMDKYEDYAMGHNPSNRMPLWVKPSAKISPKQVFDAMRDHYEGTPMDMTKDIGSGGEARPYRWRPMDFEVDGVKYVNERATATQQTGFWFVTQSRDWLPDPVGGVIWFGVDDAGTSSLTPVYCGATQVPECFREGNGHMTEYSPTAAFWLYNRVAQFAYLRYNTVGKHVRGEVDKWENAQLEALKKSDEEAAALHAANPADAIKYVTSHTVTTAQKMFDKWVELDRYLLVKYKDGNNMKEDANGFIDNGNGKHIPAFPDQPGYTDHWKRAVAADNGEVLKVVE